MSLVMAPIAGRRSLRSGRVIELLCLILFVPAAGRATAHEFWTVSTRACPQILGSDPRPFLQAFRLEHQGRFSRRDPAELQATPRPLIFLVHGSYYTAHTAVKEGLGIGNDLAAMGAIPPDAVVVAFDWPSQRDGPNLVRDLNEKSRRAFVAGYHLARFLQDFPAGSRISLVGQSHGGLAVLSALHLLGGGILDDRADATILPCRGQALRLRAVVISSASDRHWLEPGERLDRALVASEGILCLYNRLDPVLVVYPLGRYSDHRRALGKAGVRDKERLGPLLSRYCEHGIGLLIGPRHTFRGVTARPEIVRWIAPYTWSAERPA
jgi:hypothetical protein